MVDKYEPYEVNKGRELEIRNTKTGDIYSGNWAVSQMEGSDDMICIGTYEDEIRGPFEPAKLRVQNMLEKKNILTGVDVKGKKNLLINTERQLIDSGHGVVHITEDGDCSSLIETVPEDRYDDIVYVDPFDDTKQIGFNILESPVDSGHSNFDDVTEVISESFVSMLRSLSHNWGPQIGNMTKTLVNQLVRSEYSFNLIDMAKILTDEDEMEIFSTHYGGDDINQVFIDRIAEENEESFEPILRRVRAWVQSKQTRGIVCNSDSNFSLLDLIEDGKIVIFDLSNYNRTGVLGCTIASRIRVVGEALSNSLEPFVVFDGLSGKRSESYVISQVDKTSGFSFLISFERLGDYSKDIRGNLKNSEAKVSFRCGNDESEASRIALLYNTSADRMLNLGDNECVLHTMTKRGYVSDNAVDVQLFQLCPPVLDHSLTDVQERSYEKFGSNFSEIDFDNYGCSRFISLNIDDKK